MKPQLTADTASAVADLKQKWPTLHDVDRARAVHAIHQAGTSLRQLAKELNCSPTHVRNLNQAAQAPQLHHDLARQGQISTRGLVRRSKAVATLRARKDHETLERERALRPESLAQIMILLQNATLRPPARFKGPLAF